jgi:hypothetical protein
VPTNGYLLENDGHGNFRDVTIEKAAGLQGIGMITDMVWADIENDGDPDMIIIGDWMPVKVFTNDNGTFTDKSEQSGLFNTEGWWNVIKAKDLNNDGNIDFILGNHGLNSFFKASIEKPVTMYVNDFDLNGTVEQVICTYNGNKSYPVAIRDDLIKQIPSLATKYAKYVDYSDQTIEDVFSPEVLNKSIKLSARLMESCVLMNEGNGSFKIVPLPSEAQFTPVYALDADDYDNDSICDIILGGNQYKAKPQTGIYASGYGLFLKGNNEGNWQPFSPTVSGFFTRGEIRDLKQLKIGKDRIIAVARNNDYLQFYKY